MIKSYIITSGIVSICNIVHLKMDYRFIKGVPKKFGFASHACFGGLSLEVVSLI